MNVYAQILVDEARRRGIRVDILDDDLGLFRLTHGGVSVVCRESLTERTSAIAFLLCDDKRLTRRTLAQAGFRVPRQRDARTLEHAQEALRAWGRVVVKPARGEQGRGITVDVTDEATLARAWERARAVCPDVIVEEYVAGRDLRIIVIGHRFVAAAERRPAAVTGDGRSTVGELVARRNEELAARTGGECRIPVDEARRVARQAGYSWDDVLPAGVNLPVTKTANVHTGGTIHDVTDQVSPALRAVAEEASRVLNIPVVGFDFIVPDPAGTDYVILEANERPGLANHEPQPTAERFIDVLFPETATAANGEQNPAVSSTGIS